MQKVDRWKFTTSEGHREGATVLGLKAKDDVNYSGVKLQVKLTMIGVS